MSVATTDEHRAVQESIESWAAKAQPLSAVRAADLDTQRQLWSEFAAMGFLAVGLAEECGGAGGTLVDLAVIAEAAATAMIPGPIVTTMLAGALFSRSKAPIAAKLLPALADGALPCAVALTAAGLTAEWSDGGGLTVTGVAGPILGADEDATLVLGATCGADELWFVLDPGTSGVSVSPRAPTDPTRALADVALRQVSVSPDRLLHLESAVVTDLGATLFAAECAGIARWCLRTAASYAKVREQFGHPIGSFQAVKHLCAEMLCRESLSAAVAWDAAEAASGTEGPLAAAVAGAVGLDAAVENAKDCIQVLGGIGFTWDHDAHYYLRRAITLRQLLGGSAHFRRRTAQLVLAGKRRTLRLDLGDTEAGRPEIRHRAEQIAALPAAQQRQGLVESGYFAPHWPRPQGLDATPAQQLMIDQELNRARISRPNIVIGGWAVPTILAHGSPAQIEQFVGPTLRGEVRWCQLFSEPGAGSDLASLRTKAQRVDGGWRLSGQKVWTSLAKEATWAICLARTDTAAAKHKGITYFLVDMTSRGIDIRPLREITGDALFNEVFLDDVFVPDEGVVGEVNGGWKLARTTLANERVAMGGGSSLGEAVESLLELVREHGLTQDVAVHERIGALVSEGQAQSLLELRTTLRQLDGQDPGADSSVRKLVGVRHRQAISEAALDLLGPAGAASGPILRTFLNDRCLSIAGGTTQILLTVAAERILGLPR